LACGKLAQRVPGGEPTLDVRRRQFIARFAGAAAWPLAVRAHQADRMRRIGVLTNFAEGDPEAQTWATAFYRESLFINHPANPP
jgi:hypothetical protein